MLGQARNVLLLCWDISRAMMRRWVRYVGTYQAVLTLPDRVSDKQPIITRSTRAALANIDFDAQEHRSLF